MTGSKVRIPPPNDTRARSLFSLPSTPAPGGGLLHLNLHRVQHAFEGWFVAPPDLKRVLADLPLLVAKRQELWVDQAAESEDRRRGQPPTPRRTIRVLVGDAATE